MAVGESRDADYRRVAFLGPLYLVLVIDGAERTVYVEQMRWVGSPP
jgi:hypothetical protein